MQEVSVELVGRDPMTERDLFLLEVPHVEALPAEFGLPSRHFVCLLAWDSVTTPVDVIRKVAETVLGQGAVSVIAWGPGCERVHDIFDGTIAWQDVSAGLDAEDKPVIMTTWHADEPLEAALYDFLCLPSVAEDFEPDCRVQLAISTGCAEWTRQIRTALSDPRAFR